MAGDPQVHELFRGRCGSMQSQMQKGRIGAERLEGFQIIDCGARFDLALICGWKAPDVAFEQRCGACRRQRLEQRRAQAVRPRGNCGHYCGFDRLDVQLGRQRFAPNHDVKTGVVRDRDLHLRLDLTPAAALAQQLFDTKSDFGGVAVARHEGHARPKSAERVVAHHESRRAALVKVDGAANEGHELVDGRLKELIARPSLEHREHRIAVVALGIEAETVDDLGHLASHDRDFAR